MEYKNMIKRQIHVKEFVYFLCKNKLKICKMVICLKKISVIICVLRALNL